jgi:hypothetical protein
MSLGGDVGDEVDQGVELDRPQAGVCLVDKGGIEGGLPEQGQRPEDLDPVRLRVIEQAEYLLPLALQVCVVDAAVTRGEIELEDLLLLVA